MPIRHFTPPPIITLDQCWHRLDVLNDDMGRLEERIETLEEKVDNLLVESAREDGADGVRNAVVAKTLADHSQAVKAFRYRDAQLVLIGSLAITILGAIIKLAFGIHLSVGP